MHEVYEPHYVYDDEGTADINPADQIPAAPPEELTPTPEVGDNYLGASVMLPRGGTLARGHVIKRKRDQHVDATGQAHATPVLDTCEYEIEWEDDGVSATTANVIAESMYVMCDEDGNRVLLFDAMAAHTINLG